MKNGFYLAAALATAPLVSGCQTTKSLNMTTCQQVDGRSGKGILQGVLPGYRISKPSSSCITSKYFMEMVDQLKVRGNDKNYFILGRIKDDYQTLKDASKASGEDSGEARKTLAMVDQRMAAQGITMESIIAAYEKYKPRDITPEHRETVCTVKEVSVMGQIERQRTCPVAEAAPN